MENKGKLILTEIFPSVQKHDILKYLHYVPFVFFRERSEAALLSQEWEIQFSLHMKHIRVVVTRLATAVCGRAKS